MEAAIGTHMETSRRAGIASWNSLISQCLAILDAVIGAIVAKPFPMFLTVSEKSWASPKGCSYASCDIVQAIAEDKPPGQLSQVKETVGRW